MPQNLNNVATADQYTDALTVIFPFARQGFAVNIANAAIAYTLAYSFPQDREPQWIAREDSLFPAFATFTDPTHEGLPEGALYAGIKLRSFAAGAAARVTVN